MATQGIELQAKAVTRVSEDDNKTPERRVVRRKSTFETAQKHKKKIAALVTLKIIIVVVIIIVVATSVAAAAYVYNKGSTSGRKEPVLDAGAAKAFKFGTQSVIPPRKSSRRRQLDSVDNVPLGKVLRGLKQAGKLVMSSRKLAIDTTKFPKDSEYANKETSFYVAEESAAPMNTVNMILCDIVQLRADYMVDAGPYKALVDESLCTADGEKMEWTIDVKTVATGWTISIWFPMDGSIIEVLVNVEKPAIENDPINIALYFQMNQSPDLKMTGMLSKTHTKDSVKVKFGQWMDGKMQMGPNVQTFDNQLVGGISADFNPTTGVGKAISAMYMGQSKNFKLAFNKDFVLKFSSDTPNKDVCLDLRTPSQVGAQYQLYDKNGKGYVFQEGFPVKSADGASEAWVGYHGLHVQGSFKDGKYTPGDVTAFADGKKVEKIDYGSNANEGKKYTLKVDNGRLYRQERNIVTFGDLKGVKVETGPSNNRVIVMFDGTKLKKVGEKKEFCFDYETRKPLPGNYDYKTCACYGRTTGNSYEMNGQPPRYMLQDSVVAQTPSDYVIKPKDVRHGMDVRVGDGGVAGFYGNVALNFGKRVYLHGVNAGSHTKGQTVKQGTAEGVVAQSSPTKFTNLICNNCIKYFSKDWAPTDWNSCVPDKKSDFKFEDNVAWFLEGLIVTQPTTGAIGEVVSGGWNELSYTTTTGNFTANGGNLVISTPQCSSTSDWCRWEYSKYNGTIQVQGSTTIESSSSDVVVDVTKGTFLDRFATGAANVFVNDVNRNIPWHTRFVLGEIKSQPGKDTEIAYTTRKLVMPGDDVPKSLMCYNNCPVAKAALATCSSASDCYKSRPSILTDLKVTASGDNCTGTPVITVKKGGTAVNGLTLTGEMDATTKTLAAATLKDPGTTKHSCTQASYTVEVAGLTCTSQPKLEISCNVDTDYATGPQAFKGASKYSYDGVLKDSSGDKLEKVYDEEKSDSYAVHTGILFEESDANKALAVCETNDNEVCYHELRRKLKVFYEYETGSFHSKRVSLVDDAGKAVKFDQPIPVKYTHSGTKSNSGNNYNEATMILTYEGEGNLYGLPEFCMDQHTGKTVDCSPFSDNTPDITIPNDAILLTQDGTEYVAKPGEVKQIMQVANMTNCVSLNHNNVPALPDFLKDFKKFSNGEMPIVKDPLVAVAGVLVKDLAKRAEEDKE